MGMGVAFSWTVRFIFILSIFPCLGGIPLGRNPHALTALRFLICSGLICDGKMLALAAEHVVLWVMVQSPWLAGILGHVGAHQPETVGKLVCGVGGQGKPLKNHLTASSPIVCVK